MHVNAIPDVPIPLPASSLPGCFLSDVDTPGFKSTVTSPPRASRSHARNRAKTLPGHAASTVRVARTSHANVRKSASLGGIAGESSPSGRPNSGSLGSSGYHSDADRNVSASVLASSNSLARVPASSLVKEERLFQAPAVVIAVETLLTSCLASQGAAATHTGMAVPAHPDLLRAHVGALYVQGRRLHETLVGRLPNWHDRAASETAACVANLLSGISENNITFDFVQMALAYAFEQTSSPNGSGASARGKDYPLARRRVDDILPQLDILDRVGQLRFQDHPDRGKLLAALNRALGERATPRMREVGECLINVVSEIANEAFRRRVYQNEIEDLLAACEQDDIASVHAAFQCLYALDRLIASPYQTDTDRHLALIKRLSAPDQWRFTHTFVPPASNLDAPRAADDARVRRALHVYRDALQAGALPAGPMSANLQHDLQRLMDGLFAAAAFLRRDDPDVVSGGPKTTARTREMLLGMPEPLTPTLPAMAQSIWHRIKPSPLESAQRELSRTIKQQANRSGPLTPAQWQVLHTAINDIDRLQPPPGNYSNSIQKYIGALTPADCATLDEVIDDYQLIKALSDPAGSQGAYMLELDAALTREPAIRHAVSALRTTLDALQKSDRGPTFMSALEDLASYLDEYAPDPVQARMLFETALARLSPPLKHLRSAQNQLNTAQAHHRLAHDINEGYIRRYVSNPRMETAKLMSALQVLAGALERHTAR